MATTMATGGLYPPIIDTYMPAYLQEDTTYRVNFSISDFNTKADFSDKNGGLQISIVELHTNQSALNSNLWKNGYIIKTLSFEEDSLTKAYFDFSANDLNFNGKHFFPINTYLKVQIRLAGVNVPAAPDSENTEAVADWLEDNKNSFTEWSTVCLLSAITKPQVSLKIENSQVKIEEKNYLIPSAPWSGVSKNALMDMQVTMSFPQGKNKDNEDVYPTETLQSVQFYLADVNQKHLFSSEKLFPSFALTTQNNLEGSMSYSLKWNLQENNSYTLGFHTITKNLYETDYAFAFSVNKESTYGDTKSTFSIIEDIENGRVIIKVIPEENEQEFYLKRTSSEDNFNFLEDIRHFKYTGTNSFYLLDNTIKSGDFYQYALQAVTTSGENKVRKGFSLVNLSAPVLFDYAFLEGDGKSLILKYNTNFTGFQRNVSETKIETIGGQYPFVRRNGNVNYRQINLNGLITMLMDKDGIFYNKEDLLSQAFLSTENFELYRKQYDINDFNDVILEREFREKVLDFLYKNNVKLFRSAQEGNMLVKLMDIRLTPEKALGRNIYSFSCAAYEIAPATVDNYLLYDIFTKPDIIVSIEENDTLKNETKSIMEH